MHSKLRRSAARGQRLVTTLNKQHKPSVSKSLVWSRLTYRQCQVRLLRTNKGLSKKSILNFRLSRGIPSSKWLRRNSLLRGQSAPNWKLQRMNLRLRSQLCKSNSKQSLYRKINVHHLSSKHHCPNGKNTFLKCSVVTRHWKRHWKLCMKVVLKSVKPSITRTSSSRWNRTCSCSSHRMKNCSTELKNCSKLCKNRKWRPRTASQLWLISTMPKFRASKNKSANSNRSLHRSRMSLFRLMRHSPSSTRLRSTNLNWKLIRVICHVKPSLLPPWDSKKIRSKQKWKLHSKIWKLHRATISVLHVSYATQSTLLAISVSSRKTMNGSSDKRSKWKRKWSLCMTATDLSKQTCSAKRLKWIRSVNKSPPKVKMPPQPRNLSSSSIA